MKVAEFAVETHHVEQIAWLLQAIISRSPIGVAVIDYDGFYQQVNPAYCALYGYEERELLGNSFTIVFPEEVRQLTLRRHQRFLSEGAELRGEFDVVRRDGATLTVLTESVRIPDGNSTSLRLVYVVDITERRVMEDALRRNEQTYRTLFETVPQGVVYHGLDLRIRTANPAALRILGLSMAELQGTSPIDPRWRAIREDGSVLPVDEYPSAVSMRTGQPVRNVIMGVAVPDRGVAWLNVSAVPVHRDGTLAEVYTCFEDVTDRMMLSRELAQRASTDFLTGLANRRSLTERLVLEWERLRRHAERQCTVMSIDIDHFKQINDAHGHPTGDAVLAGVAQVMLRQVRSSDLVCRQGGEEFAVVLPDANLERATILAERIRTAIAAERFESPSGALAVSVSIGVSAMAASDHGAESVLERADRALYEAKHLGRNRVSVAVSAP